MNDGPKLLVRKASAGSGKTYELATQYLALALKNPYGFRHILAITFTNKATEEMKSRIIEFLQQLIQGNQALEENLRTKGLKLSTIRQNARPLLSQILHHYSYFGISTIDSFFQKVLRGFIWDLKISGAYEISFENDEALSEATHRLLESSQPNTALSDWLLSFMNESQQEGKSGYLERDIQELGQQLFKEEFYYLKQEGQEHDNLAFFQDLQQELLERKAALLQDLLEKEKRIVSIYSKHGLAATDFSGSSRSPMKGVQANVEEGVEDFGSLKEADKLEKFLDPAKWFAKSSPNRELMDVLQRDGLLEALFDYIEGYSAHKLELITIDKVLHHFYTQGLLGALEYFVETYRKEERILLSSDVNILLNSITRDNDAPFIYEKIGNRFQHFLLDEFQDTSQLQWDNIRPLIVNGLAVGKNSLLVGDLKQAIYRWRGGSVEIMEQIKESQNQADLIAQSAEEVPMRHNWRSSPTIVRFNNTLFRALTDRLLELHKQENNAESSPAMAGLRERIYHDFEQRLPEGKQPKRQGLVRLNPIPSEDAEGKKVPWKEVAMEEMAEHIHNLQQKGISAGSIAILVRRKSEAREVNDYLQNLKDEGSYAESNWTTVTQEAMELQSSRAIEAIIAVMYLVRYPMNPLAINRLQLALESLHQSDTSVEPIQEATSPLDSEDSANWREAVLSHYGLRFFFNSIQVISSRGVYELAEAIIQNLGLNDEAYASERVFLRSFLDTVLDFISGKEEGLEGFLHFWEEKGRTEKVAITDTGEAISIYTVHSSKGLEFDHVFVPFCDWSIKGRTDIFWAAAPAYDRLEAHYKYPVSFSKDLAHSYFWEDYYKEEYFRYLDNLNVLYVALTRPRHSLHIYFESIEKADKKLVNFSKQLSSISDNGVSMRQNDPELYLDIPSSSGEAIEIGEWPEAIGEAAKETDNQTELYTESAYQLQELVSSNWREKIVVARTAHHYLETARQEKLHIGSVVHDALARIHTRDTQDKGFRHLERNLNKQQQSLAREMLEYALLAAELQAFFDEQEEIMREPDMLWKTPQGYEDIRPDRLVIRGKNVLLAEFKTGSENEAQYKRQIQKYVKALLDMGFASVEAKLCYLADQQIHTDAFNA